MSTDTITPEATVPSVPEPENTEPAKPAKEKPAPRGKLDPITVPIWRLPRAARREILEPFVGELVIAEVWPLRIASGGDRQYKGTLVTVALSTTGTTADFAIISTLDGNVWALSTAQIAYFAKVDPKPAKATKAAKK